ncbi:MAG: zinc-finger domain-containing protein [Proteobacteria bacterium]|nr:zinc-finger domain-containing protein [Pseudomonadota bacterium]
MSWTVVTIRALGYKFEKTDKGIKTVTIAPPETVKVSTIEVACDGGEGALGHPKVYLNMGDEGGVECPYCDKLFILEDGPRDKKGNE